MRQIQNKVNKEWQHHYLQNNKAVRIYNKETNILKTNKNDYQKKDQSYWKNHLIKK